MASPDPRRDVVATVHPAAIAENARRFSALGRLIAVVKADGYGHGAATVARAALAGGATGLGVATVDEALQLRASGLDAPVLSWLNPLDAPFAEAAAAGIELAVPSLAHLERIAEAGGAPRVHLHLDLGMSRDGAAERLWQPLFARAAALAERGAVEVAGLMGLLGCADTPEAEQNDDALRLFLRAERLARAQGLPTGELLRHVAATSAALGMPEARLDAVRVGAGLVGIDPSHRTVLAGAMTLTAPVIGVRDIPAGALIGYGTRARADRPLRLAQLGAGYADGVPASAQGRAHVLLGGRLARVVAVNMDQLVVEAGDALVRAGDVATVFGPGTGGEPTLADWAGWAGTREHEIVTRVGAAPRVRRVTGAAADGPAAGRERERVRVAVVGGGENPEHAVGLASAAAVRAGLDAAGYDAVPFTIAPTGEWVAGPDDHPAGRRPLAAVLAAVAACDVVFPVVHGERGEDGALAALCELAGVPVVGSRLRAGVAGMDKRLTKLVAADAGIRVAAARVVRAGDDLGGIPLPAVVKPVATGSSVGVGLVRSPDALPAAVAEALAHGPAALVEEFVVGREIDVAVLRRADGSLFVGPPLEIRGLDGGVFDRATKYGAPPAFAIGEELGLTAAEHRALSEAAVAVYTALECDGLARVDFFLTADGPVLNEVNTMPGMTEHSQVPRMFAAAGMGYPELLAELVTAELVRAEPAPLPA